MEYFPVILFFLVLLVLILRPFTVLLHELGHAIPAILITRQKVSIFIGSYGDPTKSFKFRIGLLEVWFKFNLFLWQLGLCVPSTKHISVNQQILIILAGPLTTFIISGFACYLTFIYDSHGLIKLILVVFLGLSLLDLYVNLIPGTNPIKLWDGSLVYNDGYQLKQMIYYKLLPKEYKQAIENYKQQNFSESARLFQAILEKGLKDENMFRLGISSFLQIKNYEQAERLTDDFLALGKMNDNDYANAGFLFSKIGCYDKALGFCDKSLELNPSNKFSLNNKGYVLNLTNSFEEAIPFFDKAIDLDSKFAYSFNNRGLAKIKTGKIEEGLGDIKHSLKLDKDNSYGYRNLGIYHLGKLEFSEALKLFKKAKELDSDTHMIDELIGEAEIGLKA